MLSNRKRNLLIKRLELEEARAVYIGHAHRDFPSDELKPFSMIEKLWNNGCYYGYGFYEAGDDPAFESVLRAYAFMAADTVYNMLLLDYFAVCENDRGKGYGSAALALFKEECESRAGIIFEVEDDECSKSQKERHIRQRRIAFYEKNGVEMTAVRSYAFGVDYKLMVMDLGVGNAKESLDEKLSHIYRIMLPKPVFDREFRIR